MNPRIIIKIALPFLALTALACDKSAPETGQAVSEDARVVEVTAGADGFQPNLIQAAKDEKLTLRFKRTTDGTCAKDVDFPELGIKRDLPLQQPVAIQIPTSEARTIKFQCGMGMYESRVVVQ